MTDLRITADSRQWSDRLAELGISLPLAAAPLGVYVPAKQVGSLVYTSGQLPLVSGVLPTTGRVGAEITEEQGYELAGIAVLNALAAIDELVGIDSVIHIVKLVGFIASATDFIRQPAVLNGASELLGHIFGDAGKHVRSAVGVSQLPLDSPVELELIVEIGG